MQAFFGVEKVLELTPQRQNCLELCKNLLAESGRSKWMPATINERLSQIVFKLSQQPTEFTHRQIQLDCRARQAAGLRDGMENLPGDNV